MPASRAEEQGSAVVFLLFEAKELARGGEQRHRHVRPPCHPLLRRAHFYPSEKGALFCPAATPGTPEMSAYFFVMYYCVLSMVTPPVALASFADAGVAGGGGMGTSVSAFHLSFVSFLIPFTLAFCPKFPGNGNLTWMVAAFLSLAAGTMVWAIAVVGSWKRCSRVVERIRCGATAAGAICAPTGTTEWLGPLGAMALVGLRLLVARNGRFSSWSQASSERSASDFKRIRR